MSTTLQRPGHPDAPPRPRPSTRSPRRRSAPVPYLVPALVVLGAFALWPLVVLVRMSLSDVGPANIVGEWAFVGLANFEGVLGEAETWQATLRTLLLCGVLLVSNLVIGFLAATVLSVSGRVTQVVLSVMVFIWALPPLVSGSVWKFLLNDTGPLNAGLSLLGLPAVNWLSDPGLAMWSVAGVTAWASLPFSALILRGGLTGISPELLEAAAIDGAGFWRTQLQIVLPLLRPTLWILSIITVLYAFKAFDFFYVMTQGGPGTSTNTLPVLSYYAAFSNFEMSTGATVAVVSMLVVALFAVPYVRSVKAEVVE